MRRANLAVFFLAAVVSVTACGNLIEQSAMDTTANILWRARAATMQESDIEVARVAMPGALKTVEGFSVANPDNALLHAMLAEGWCSYATGFVQDDWEAAKAEGRFDDADRLRPRASALFLRCMNYGLKMLPGAWAKAIDGDLAGVLALVKHAGKSNVKGMFWTALGLASAINMNRDDIEMVAHLPKAKAMLEKVVALSPNYQNGMALIALGMINTAQGTALGGKPELGKEFFERAVAATDGRFLMAKVLEARNYAVIVQDRALFRKLLIDVLRTDPGIWPEQRLANALAQHKARRYLSQEKQWF